MQKEHRLVREVYAAKTDMEKADRLIRDYIPFIRSETAKFLTRFCTDQDDEYSIALIAFHEAILGYSRERGAFLSYAAMLIRSRLIDYQRKEVRHQNQVSLYEEQEEDGRALIDELQDGKNHYEEPADLEATKQEIEELAAVMANFGVSFSDVSDHSPKQERTLEACRGAIRCGAEDGDLLAELLRTRRLPMARLAALSGVERKTLERHRKYILAMLLIQTNGYEIIRGHLRHVLRRRGGLTA